MPTLWPTPDIEQLAKRCSWRPVFGVVSAQTSPRLPGLPCELWWVGWSGWVWLGEQDRSLRWLWVPSAWGADGVGLGVVLGWGRECLSGGVGGAGVLLSVVSSGVGSFFSRWVWLFFPGVVEGFSGGFSGGVVVGGAESCPYLPAGLMHTGGPCRVLVLWGFVSWPGRSWWRGAGVRARRVRAPRSHVAAGE